MTIEQLLQNIAVEEYVGALNVEVKAVDIDSRLVRPGHLFIAVKGTQVDGHRFIDKAIAAGAKVIVQSEALPQEAEEGITRVRVADTEAVAGEVASAFYGHPSAHLRLVGVTGTNGKTTVATVLYNMFRAMGHKVGLLSTVCNYIDGEAVPSTHTTPDAVHLNELLSRMVAAGCEYVFMECSSHAIAQRRIGGLLFAGGVFTNLTRDHLDYHKTFENYRNAKKQFFDLLPKTAFAVTNYDDRNGLIMTQSTKARVVTYSTRAHASHRGRIVEESLEGMLLNIDGQEVSVPFIGQFNVSNLLAVYATALELGCEAIETLRVMSMLQPVNGRFEAIRSPKGLYAIVDYAHTPDALINVLDTINEIVKGQHKVITVCGAGGNRDKGKRPLMAAEAVKRSDRLILTSDNPRDEDPECIIKEMLEGVDEGARGRVLCITARREAIRTAVMLAEAGDVILVAGKGHEPYQEVNGVKLHFDDHEEVREAFAMGGG